MESKTTKFLDGRILSVFAECGKDGRDTASLRDPRVKTVFREISAVPKNVASTSLQAHVFRLSAERGYDGRNIAILHIRGGHLDWAHPTSTLCRRRVLRFTRFQTKNHAVFAMENLIHSRHSARETKPNKPWFCDAFRLDSFFCTMMPPILKG